MSDEVKEPIKENKEPIKMNATPQYDPAKQYTWDPAMTVEITGQEFGMMLNAIRGVVATKEAMQVRMALQANDAIEKIMAHGVGIGTIIEVEPKK